jgi:mRNA-degrading endonuclease HigB of HigAB toxin-antitoxin module
VTVGPAAIQGPLSPAAGAQNTSITVAVTGSQTHFLQGTTTASFGGGIQVTGVTVIDLLHANVNITIPASTALGFYDVALTTNGEVTRILGGFTVTAGTPILTVVNPPTGHQGDAPFDVALTGLFTNFNTAPGCSPCSLASFGAGITVATLKASDATHAVAHITIDPAATITDYAGNVMTPTTSTFTTGAAFDFTSPTVVSAYPANGAIGVVATTVPSVIFSEAMDPVLMTSSQVYLQTHNTHTIVPVTLSISADFKTVYLTPTAPLSPLTIYDVAIYGNNWWPYDIAGNSFSLSGYVTYNSGYVYTTFTTQ